MKGIPMLDTDAVYAAVEKVTREVCAYSNVAAAVVPPENHTASAACLRANGLDLEV
jgi:nucleotidyltransferase/DNA polymerase involved in DNA repair